MKRISRLLPLLVLLSLACTLGSAAAGSKGVNPAPILQNACGDGVCTGPENPQTCPADCASGSGQFSTPAAPGGSGNFTPPTGSGGFSPAPVESSGEAISGEQPLYFFLFTHTEDPFNHELSEERYIRFVPEVEARAASHPEANLTWTIMFQGSDARTVAERNPQTLSLLHI